MAVEQFESEKKKRAHEDSFSELTSDVKLFSRLKLLLADARKQKSALESRFDVEDHSARGSCSHCEIAAEEYETKIAPLFQELISAKINNDIDEEKKLVLDAIIDSVNPFPINKEIYLREKTKLENAARYAKEHQLLQDELTIHKQHLPALTFNFALFFDKHVQSLIYNRKFDIDSEEDSTSEKGKELEDLINKAQNCIELYQLAHSSTSEAKFLKVTLTSLSKAYERLADLQFDLANTQDVSDKIKFLNSAIQNYKRALNGTTSNLAINLSIINAEFSIYEQLYDSNLMQEAQIRLERVHGLLTNTKTNLNNYPDVVFYELYYYSQMYRQTNNEEYRQHASKYISTISPQLKKLKDLETSQLVYGWLKRFTRALNITEFNYLLITSDFTMAQPDESHFKQKRLQQACENMRLLRDDNYKNFFNVTFYAHQKEALNASGSELDKNIASGYIELPTGGGKTMLMSAETLTIKMPTLIVVSTIQLVEQTIKGLRALNPKINISRFDGTEKTRFMGEICVTTYHSLQRDMKLEPSKQRLPFTQFGLTHFDEAHRALSKLRSALVRAAQEAGAIVRGYTATPEFNCKRKNGDFSRASEVFGPCIYICSMQRLIKDKVLSPVKNIVVVAPAIDPSIFRRKKKDEDYTQEELELLINNDKLNEIPVDLYKNGVDPDTGEKLCGKKTLIFCAGVGHAQALAKKFNDSFPDREYPIAAVVHGEMSAKERERIFELHRQGHIPILLGCDVFIEGYDHPPDTIAFNLRPTRSLVMAKQRAGRLLRFFTGKAYATIFDWSWGIDQVLFRQFLNNEYRVGDIKNTAGLTPMPTVGYDVLWDGATSLQSTKPPSNNNEVSIVTCPAAFFSPPKSPPLAIPLDQSLLSDAMQITPLEYKPAAAAEGIDFVPDLSLLSEEELTRMLFSS